MSRSAGTLSTLPDLPSPLSTLVREGLFERILEVLAADLRERGGLDLSECFIDGTFIVANNGEGVLARPSGARVRSSWQWRTALVYLSPLAPPRLRLTKVASSPPPSTRDS
jgi:hypothetical protein